MSASRLRLLQTELQTVLATSRSSPVRRLYTTFALNSEHAAPQAESSQSAKGKTRARTLEAESADEHLFEPLNQEYRTASTKLSRSNVHTLQKRATDLDQVISLLTAGLESQAASMLQHKDIPNDPAFESIAASFLDAGDVEAFLRWWAYTPDSSGIQGLRAEEGSQLKANVHALERQLLSQPNAGNRLSMLQRFALLAATKGKAAYIMWTLQELAMFLPRGEFQPWFQQFRATLMKRADALATGSWQGARPYRSQARVFLDHLQSRLTARRARAGFPVEAARWLLSAKYPSAGSNQARLLVTSIMSVYHSIEHALSALPACDPTALQLLELRPQVRALVKTYAPQQLLAFDVAAESTALIMPEAPSLNLMSPDRSNFQIDGLGMTLMKSLSLSQAQESIQHAVQWGGLQRISAHTLAGYIHVLCRCSGVAKDQASPGTLRPWQGLKIPALDPQESTAAKTLWVSAFMLFHLRHTSAEQAIHTFVDCCMPFGAPSLLTITMRQQSSQANTRDLIWPSRFTLSILWQALVEQSVMSATDSRSRQIALEELYESFLSTFYGSQACPIELRPDAVTFQPFVDAFSKQGLPYRCLEVLLDMHNRGIKPDDRSWVPAMAALAKQPDPKLAFAILSRMEDGRTPFTTELAKQDAQMSHLFEDVPPPNIGTYTALIKGFSMAALPALARQVQVRLEARVKPEDLEWHWTKNLRLRSAIEHLEETERSERASIGKGTLHTLA